MKAAIKKIRTRVWQSYRSDQKWDSYDVETICKDAIAVIVSATGYYKWKYFNVDGQLVQGISKVAIQENKEFWGDNYQKEADDYILDRGVNLEKRGYNVELIEEDKDNLGKRWYSKRKWLENRPPEEVLGKVRTYDLKGGIEDLICNKET
ncbi:MAG: hypothetical protein KKA62_04405 [Nanoarchaeota archaeon]|nr:hypothetical protein [Nanoarchaeota archaeon]MBU1977162.1 hypothetical protein [Nanoarchaeota archaeon]